MWIALAAALLLCACERPFVEQEGPVADWPSFGGDPGGLRYSPLTQITPENVTLLREAWTYRHGDFSDANTLLADGAVGIFDFDDCGYGPIEFEVGNSLYMVLFDAAMTGDHPRYERFRDWFVTSYEATLGTSITDATLDAAIRLRIDALGRWLDDLRLAPIGIRTASPEWHGTLRTFVETH